MTGENNETALITGASSGLGEAFARILASRGCSLILTARRLDRLTALADELNRQHGISCQVVSADLADEGGIACLEKWIEKTDSLSLLINNAGFGVKGCFSDGALEKHLRMIQVHVIAAVRLTRAALPGMLARRRGGIINVASMAAFFPYRSSTYAATKAYLVAFSEGIASELDGTGVTVQALCPGFFYSEFHDTPEMAGFRRSSIPSFLWLRAEDIVRESLRALERQKSLCIPGVQYKIITWLTRFPISNGLIASAARSRFIRRFDTAA